MKVNPKEEPDARFTYLDISSIDNTTFRITAPKTYLGSEAPSRARQLVHANDVLFSTVRTYLKNLAMVPEVYDGEIASTGFSVLRAQNGVSAKYLFYYCLTPEFLTPLEQLQRGTSYPAVRDGDVREQPLPLAPLPEQHRIVAEIETHLTRLDAGVAALKRAQAKLRRYRAAILKATCEGQLVPQDPTDEPAEELLKRILAERRAKWEADELAKMRARGKEPKDDKWKQKYKEPAPPDTSDLPELPAGWVWVTIDQMVSMSQNGIGKRRSEVGMPTIVLRLADVTHGTISFENVRRIRLTRDEIGKYGILDGDLLCTRVNGSRELAGRMALFRPTTEPVTFCDHFIRLRTVEHDSASFLSYYFDTNGAREYVESGMVSSAGQNTVSQRTISSIPAPLPPITEQRRIVAEVDRLLSVVEEREAAIEANLKRAERLRQAILKHAFEGKLVPQDPADEPASALWARIKAERAARAPMKQGRKKNVAEQP